MSKRPKFDESGDSDELQALFDSIAAEPVAGRRPPQAELAVLPGAPASDDASGDNDELQALFDAVAMESGQFGDGPAMMAASRATVQAPAAAGADEQTDSEAVFHRLGHLTRQVHDTLRELGLEATLQEAAEAIPDARQRLHYIARMTEQAASRVLNATDVARPIQDELASGADALAARWDRLYAGKLSPEAFRELSADTRGFIGEVASGSRATSAQLHEIMMAQDFQDLTGQVIKRVVELAQMLESQLLQVLLEAAPPAVRSERHSSLLNGPVIDGSVGGDVLNNQAQVDDLLESLGF
ncbi:MAG TPA: protein phosphatase CheZ [Thauera sp.]|uniref:protein phosphatase CheZ n=1 Tax=Thauera sp. TaxID=1905334 RepID=UPI002C3B58B5|nr:protein phosphatase CheZ [Thauera sp.]HRP24998.1 protein phosphatase CheZ [Thauera sp.]HRP65020.1 protein phosphatase CheZ [Thauera sp.]